MTNKRRIVLARHGATEWSESGRHTGRTDLPLLPLGERQAKALGEALAGQTFARVFSSPLLRAANTARLAGFGDRLELSDLLLEMDYGEDEGRTRAAIREERPSWDVFLVGPKGGETAFDVAARCRRFLKQIEEIEGDGDILLFAHGHLIRTFTATYLRQSPMFASQLELGAASLSVLGHNHEHPSLQRWNDRTHLAAIS
jgi:broad specificity phosphatase PhoE